MCLLSILFRCRLQVEQLMATVCHRVLKNKITEDLKGLVSPAMELYSPQESDPGAGCLQMNRTFGKTLLRCVTLISSSQQKKP